jgi:sporulation protein YlmC with PRC-barrel domain
VEAMMKRTFAAALAASALLTMPLAAQTGKFITQEKPDQWRASKLVGVDVYNQNNDKIGDIREVIVDKTGKADAVVIGVGGFLGIGQKDVAVAFSDLKWSDQPVGDKNAKNAKTPDNSNRSAATNPAATNPAATGLAPTNPAATNAAATNSAATNSAASNRNRAYPDHAILNLSRDELKNAPDFKYAQ